MRPGGVLSRNSLSSTDAAGSSKRKSFMQGETDRILSYYENHAAPGSVDSEDENDHRPLRRPPSPTASELSSSSEYSLDNTQTSSTPQSRLRGSSGGSVSVRGDLERAKRLSRPNDRALSDPRQTASTTADSSRIHGKTVADADGTSLSGHRNRGGSAIAVVAEVSRSSHTSSSTTTGYTASKIQDPNRDSKSPHHRSTSEAAGAPRDLRRESRDVRDRVLVGDHNGRTHSTRLDSHSRVADSGAPVTRTVSSMARSTAAASADGHSHYSNLEATKQSFAASLPSSLNTVHDMSRITTTVTSASPSSTVSTSFSSSMPSSYLHYQPGIHSTAGPPPPPIQRVFTISSTAPPRPPRLHAPQPSRYSDQENTKDAPSRSNHNSTRPTSHPSESSSQIDTSSVEKLSEQQVTNDASQETPERNSISSSTTLRPSRSMHIREGAFPPSSSGLISAPASPPTSVLNDSVSSENSSQGTKYSPITDDEPFSSSHDAEIKDDTMSTSTPDHTDDMKESAIRPSMGLRRDSSWVDLRITVDPEPLEEDAESIPSSVPDLRHSPFKATLTTLKRFSTLPRTPSMKSVNLRVDGEVQKVSRSPSPSLPPIPLRRKIISRWPAPMQYADVLACRNSLDRSLGYANKINELALYDCGLGDWIISMKHRGPPSRRPSSRPTSFTSTYQTHSTQSETRKISNGSITSEATFPMRPDAYIATDLSPRPDDTLPTAAPSLPYPALVQRSMTAARSPQQGSSSTLLGLPNRTGGFFASIGKKSTLKKDRSSPVKFLTRRPTVGVSPRPVEIGTAPVVPGGPRAPPNRSRSVTVTTTSPSPADPIGHGLPPKRRSTLVRRPSLFSSPKGAIAATPGLSNSPEFLEQLDNLTILLPHADRAILAGYLRRSGQDILAVGKYLEDEKNGTVIRY